MLLAGYVTPSYVEKTLKGPQQHSEIEALPAMANPCKRRIYSIHWRKRPRYHLRCTYDLPNVSIYSFQSVLTRSVWKMDEF